jgi:hypothetical protein
MKPTIKISQAILYGIALFFILMSLDAFEESNTIWQNIFGFLIHASFGFGLILLTYFLRKQYFIFGLLLIFISIFFFFFFDMYENLSQSIYIILIIFLPMLISGIVHIIYARKQSN